MKPFTFKKSSTKEEALTALPKRKFVGGGTTLVDLMKLEVEVPETLVDVNQLPYQHIGEQKNGDWLVGAVVKNSELAYHKEIRKNYLVLSEAILAGASAQLRNKATTAGNLLQRTRCPYFRDTSKACNKRSPGSGCAAVEGHNRNLAILGTSESCIATNPSDMNVAMMALEAKVQVSSLTGERAIDIKEFYLLPGSTPHLETTLKEDELITGVTLPGLPKETRSHYLKLRDRASYEFALSSIAIVMTLKAGKMDRVRIAMGGVGTRPWRVEAAEKILEGQAPSEDKFKEAAEIFLKGAKAQTENGFKIELARRCFIKGLKNITSKAA